MFRLAVSAAIASSLIVHARPSAACGVIPQCDSVEVLPAPGAAVPSNAPALAFFDAAIATNFELHKATGELVATTTSATADAATNTKFLFLSTPLTAGEAYEVRWSPNCQVPNRSSVSFTAGPAAPLPTTMGSVTVAESLRGDHSSCGHVWNTSQSSDGGHQAATFFEFAPSAELVPYLPIAKIVSFVDGQPVNLDIQDITTSTSTSRRGIRTVCVTDPGYDTYGTVSAGLHHIRLEAIVAGATSQPLPLEFDANVQCEPASAATPEESSASSCAVSSSRPAGVTVGLVATVVAVASSLLRRRRSKSRH
ncbi:hypothetical protein AKJ09_07393 [Labilithrix luteola]|uniref:SbsA Ig-like domain-containing protein n=1 Tax=Labilithrix luteola TaxID=1391654 RepID=A0A0K1Q5S1_9BACT|nr:hypothetical protein AKJ09_07393 [Labilithrix luteola]